MIAGMGIAHMALATCDRNRKICNGKICNGQLDAQHRN